MKLDILAIGAHPDDVEMSCGGTIAKEIAKGKKVGILDLTRGELGTRGSAEIRDQEGAAAAAILGVSVRHNLALADGFFQNDPESQLKVIHFLRKYKPEIVLCNATDDRHIDHPKGSDLASNACFLSGLKKDRDQGKWRDSRNLETKTSISLHTMERSNPRFCSRYYRISRNKIKSCARL